jgi:3-hydroxyisobutyrate dehydrogenase-like beta-hydroxyacid dehydrogenase
MTEIAFLGLGMIGAPMAERLLDAGHHLVVWNRTPAKPGPLVDRGARQAASPCDAAEAAEVVVTMLTDGAAVLDLATRAGGLLAGLASGKVHCDMSTIDLASARRLAELYRRHSIGFVHAPVLGNRHAAREGKLLVFAGGPAAARERARPVFDALAQRVWNWDRPEQGTAMKLAANLLLGGMMEIFAETLVFAAGAGLDPRALLEVIAASSLAAPMFQSKGRMILDRGAAPNFYLRNMRKDLDLILASAGELKVPLPVGSAVREIFAAAEPEAGDRDYSAVVEWLERQAGVQVK